LAISLTDLERQLKVATRTGKYVVGRREVTGSLKGSKLIVWSASANLPTKILDECKTLQIPAIRFDGNPIELGKTCGIPFKVSVIAVKSAGDAVLSQFEGSQDYSQEKTAFQMRQLEQQQRTPIEVPSSQKAKLGQQASEKEEKEGQKKKKRQKAKSEEKSDSSEDIVKTKKGSPKEKKKETKEKDEKKTKKTGKKNKRAKADELDEPIAAEASDEQEED
jgi:large subunit ribosomal protein L30e